MPHNAVSCSRLVFAAHTSCVWASWRLLPEPLTRLPGARSGRPPESGRPVCGATKVSVGPRGNIGAVAQAIACSV